MPAIFNIFADIPVQGSGEFFQDILRADSFRIERIVSHGEKSPDGFWFDQEENEWVMLLAGEAELSFEDGKRQTLTAGDYLLIPAHTRHRVEKTAPEQETIWLAVHFGGRITLK